MDSLIKNENKTTSEVIQNSIKAAKNSKFIKEIPDPVSHYISDFLIRDQRTGTIDYKVVMEHFQNQGRLTHDQLKYIIDTSTLFFKNEPNLVVVNSENEIFVVGDIHGQYYDLLHIISNFDFTKDKVVFLGDYVDRGKFSIETYFILLCLKITYPDNLIILRGNHETIKMTQYFTFKEECIIKYDENTYDLCCNSFQQLPISAVINGNFYCAHGGISPHLKELDDINKINRFTEPPFTGLFCDILWSDPARNYENSSSEKLFAKNHQRNCSYFYNSEAVTNFLLKNKLKCIIRGHEVQNTGFQMYYGTQKSRAKNIPSVITIFSAPNYCGYYGNSGGFVKIKKEKINICQFEAMNEPFYLPNYLDGLNWSFPFLAEKSGEFLLDLFKMLSERESFSSSESTHTNLDSVYAEEINNVKLFAGAMGIMRTERECLNELEDEESSELPCCSLKTITNDNLSYEEVKNRDSKNEKFKNDDEIDESTTCSLSSSQAPELTKLINKLALDETLLNAELIVNEKKNVVDVKIKNEKEL